MVVYKLYIDLVGKTFDLNTFMRCSRTKANERRSVIQLSEDYQKGLTLMTKNQGMKVWMGVTPQGKESCEEKGQRNGLQYYC